MLPTPKSTMSTGHPSPFLRLKVALASGKSQTSMLPLSSSLVGKLPWQLPYGLSGSRIIISKINPYGALRIPSMALAFGKKLAAWLFTFVEGVPGSLGMARTSTSCMTLGMKANLSLKDILSCNSIWIKGFLLYSNPDLGPSLLTCPQQFTIGFLRSSQTSLQA